MARRGKDLGIRCSSGLDRKERWAKREVVKRVV